MPGRISRPQPPFFTNVAYLANVVISLREMSTNVVISLREMRIAN